jgi:hypothetical protein
MSGSIAGSRAPDWSRPTFYAPILSGEKINCGGKWSVILAGVLFHGGWLIFALITLRLDQLYRQRRQSPMQHE